MPRSLLEGVDIFLKSVERQGESGHDVRVSQAMLAWLLAHMEGACRRPRHDEKRFITFPRKFTPGDATSRRDVPFAVGVRGFLTNSFFTYLVQLSIPQSSDNLQKMK